MPIDYKAAPDAKAPPAAGPIERSAVTAAVERYLASRGVGPGGHPAAPVAPAAQPVSFVVSNIVDRYLASRGVRVAAPAGTSSSAVSNVVDRYLASRGAPAAAPAVVSSSVVPNVSAQVVDRFLARRGASAPKTEFG